MTREEIEQGWRLIATYRAAGVHPEWFSMATDWLLDNADELLSLAEEARWRSVTEEPPPIDTFVTADMLPLPALLNRYGQWVSWNGTAILEPKNWRPLPKGPER